MDYQKTYHTWLQSQCLTNEEKEALKALSHEEILERFGQDLSFGTAGIRAILGLGTNRLNRFTTTKITLGIVKYLKNNNLNNGVVIGFDNRHYSKEFSRLITNILRAYDIKVYLFDNLRPTPFVSYAISEYKASMGIMITASHNPKEYNGIKVYNQEGAQLNDDEAHLLTELINEVTDYLKEFPVSDANLLDCRFDQNYFKTLKNILNPLIKPTANIIYSPLHGTGSQVIPQYLKALGYLVNPVKEQMIVDPDFKAILSTNPEEAISFDLALKKAKQQKDLADVILLTDPDADRLGVAVLHNNEYVLLNGNQTPCLILQYLMQNRNLNNAFVVSTIVSTPLLKKITQTNGLVYQETLTGFKNIANTIKHLKPKYQFGFAAEESYGCLVSDFVKDKDAVQACCIIAEMVSYLKLQNKTLIDYLEMIYQKYGYYLENTINLELKGSKGLQQIQAIMNYFRDTDISFEKPLLNKQDFTKPQESNLTLSNVIKYTFEHSWFVVRPSGTEPKLKIYFGSHHFSLENAKIELNNLKQEITAIMNNIGGSE